MWCSSKKNSMTEIDKVVSDYADWLVNDEPHTPEEIRKGAEMLRQANTLGYSMDFRVDADESGNVTGNLIVRKIR